MKRTSQLSWLLALALSASAAAAQEQQGEHEGRNYTTRVVRVKDFGRGFLGVQLTPLTPELRVHFGVPEDTGVMVARVEDGGPAEAAGIQVGDILSSIDGERVDSTRRLARTVRGKKEGDLVSLELYRNGNLESYTVTVSERDRDVISLTSRSGGYGFIPGMDELGELPDHDFEFELGDEHVKAFELAIGEFGEHYESGAWQEKLERIEGLDFTTIQERMKEVERRLQELEQELEKEGRKDF